MLSPRLYLRSPNVLCVVTVLILNRLFENTYICVLSRRLLLCANYLLFADHFQLFTLLLLLCLHYCNYRSQKQRLA
jgi:hypothetical protein